MFRLVRMVNPITVKTDSYSFKLFNPELLISFYLHFIRGLSKASVQAATRNYHRLGGF